AAGRKPPPSVECAATMTGNDSTGPSPAAPLRRAPADPHALSPLIDIGINLGHDSYDADRDSVIARALAAGVEQMMVTGSSTASSRQAAALAGQHPGRLFATAGVHPHHATELAATALAELGELCLAPEVVAVGECGLDYYRNFSPHPAQRAAFQRQLELAARCGKPVFLHQRDAHEDFIAILREHWPALSGGVAHCFTGGAAELECYLGLGLAIGITGWICDERRGAHLLELVRRIPADRLLLETDGPYLLPRDLQPKPASRRNEPVYLAHIAAVVARARGEPAETLARTSTEAARRLFRLPRIDFSKHT
ncbi:MAG: TatD family hydrolase, partial [Steroidobacteraceae bacterium]